MRLALLVALLLTPGAAAWAVEVRAPANVDEGRPFEVEVCAEAIGRGQVRVMAQNATLDVREDRYLPAFEAAACRRVVATASGGRVEIEARLRAEGSSSVKARAYANATLTRASGDLRLLDAWALPFEGVVIRNMGNESAALGLRTLDGEPLPNATIEPGETAFLGPRAPPGIERHVPAEVRVRNGSMTLAIGTRAESSLIVPKLRSGASTLGPYGRTNLSWSGEVADLSAFATPGPTPIPSVIDSAREEVLVAAHTLTSHDIAAALVAAADRGARVRVLLEGAPPGGIPPEERAIAATLAARGVEVLVMGGEGARYRTMHAKIVIADRARAVVSTENLNDGNSRGFGLVVDDAALARALADVLDHDAAPWHDIRRAGFPDPPAELVASLREGPMMPLGPAEATLILSPDDPRALAQAVSSARRSLDVAMLRADAEGPMIDALVRAARQGASVRLLLDARHDDGANRELAAKLVALAQRDGLSLHAKLDDPQRTLHAKTLIVDGQTSYVGSMNWVRAAWQDNREAGLLVENDALAAWLTQEFEKDWNEEKEEARAEVPAPLWIVLAASALSGLLRAPSRPAADRERDRKPRPTRAESSPPGAAPNPCSRP